MLPTAATLAAAPQPAVPPAATPVRLDAFQSLLQHGPGGDTGDMGRALSNAMDGFGARAAQMQASIREIAMRDAGAGRVPATGETAAPSLLSAGSGPPMQGPMALMVDCFNFAIEASLVSRAATQFTSSVSTLMKGQ